MKIEPTITTTCTYQLPKGYPEATTIESSVGKPGVRFAPWAVTVEYRNGEFFGLSITGRRLSKDGTVYNEWKTNSYRSREDVPEELAGFLRDADERTARPTS
jgi:hypothetical protein